MVRDARIVKEYETDPATVAVRPELARSRAAGFHPLLVLKELFYNAKTKPLRPQLPTQFNTQRLARAV